MSHTLELDPPPSRRALPEDYWDSELVPREDPRAAFISVNPERMGGTACFPAPFGRPAGSALTEMP